jgi:hypothetical protein
VTASPEWELAIMHVRIPVIAIACGILSLSGCGGGGDTVVAPQTFTSKILSDPRFDGDIEQTSSGFTITQGMSSSVQTVFAGIDPAAGTEFRAFLDFPLTGSGGVPGNASISSAFLEFLVDDLQPITGKLPVRIDLVAFPQPMIATDFDRNAQPALASVIVTPDISRADVGTLVPIDVTALMVEAQRRGLGDFQVRIMEDTGPPISVLMIIDDSTGANRASQAPLLTVTYF